MPESHPHVLIVDDHPKVLRVIHLGLKVRGYTVNTLLSGEEALESIKSEPPDIVILDVRMPGMDGFELLRRLREFSRVPIIAYSATPEYAERALSAGASAFLPKPFEMNALENLVRDLTNGRTD